MLVNKILLFCCAVSLIEDVAAKVVSNSADVAPVLKRTKRGFAGSPMPSLLSEHNLVRASEGSSDMEYLVSN